MFTKIRIKNFKSYHDATIYLAPITFFIGQNASGKSNALEVFRLLNIIARGYPFDEIENIIQNREGMIRGNIVDLFKDSTYPIEFECTILDKEIITVSLYLSLYKDKFILSGEDVYKNEKKLYSAKNVQLNNTDILNVTYNICKNELNSSIQCTNQQAIFFSTRITSLFL